MEKERIFGVIRGCVFYFRIFHKILLYWATLCVRQITFGGFAMDMKFVGVGVLAIGAAAIGGIVLWTGDEDKNSVLDREIALRTLADDLAHSTEQSDYIEMPVIEQRNPDQEGRGRGDFSPEDIAARLAQYDADGDGFLSDEERDQMRKDRRDEMLARLDLDGDGEISRDERRAARQDRFEQSERGQRLMREFDLDGDGELSADEQAAMDEHMAAERDARRAEQIAEYDADGDGQLSRDERRTQREDTMSDLTSEFDLDGDGELNIEEQMNAMNTSRERREIDQFVNRYDADGDGAMGAGDYNSFLNDYSNGSLRADVNGDGTINTLDMTAYTEMVTRSGNRP